MQQPLATTAYIGLGSNLGDRAANLARALELLSLRAGVAVVKHSSWRQTAPVGCPAGAGDFLNGAAELATSLPPLELLTVLLSVEREMGRVRGGVRNESRVIDLDLLLHGDAVGTFVAADGTELQLPHPRLHQRDFVLTPLCQLAPALVVAPLGVSVSHLLEKLHAAGETLK